jgi:hypothetical protein
VYTNPADHSELKRERWTASVTYVFRENVKNNELAVNPLGLLDEISEAKHALAELEIKKPKANGASTKLSANQKPCEKMAEAILMGGGKRGQVVKVCADPACRVHHPNTPSPQ